MSNPKNLQTGGSRTPGGGVGFSSGETIAKEKRKPIIMRLGKYLMRHKWAFCLALVLTVISNTLALFGPELAGKAINAIGIGKGQANFNAVYRYALLMVICYVLSAILTYLLNALMISLSRKVVYQMRQDIFNHLATLHVSFFDKNSSGDIISRISYDTDTINVSLSNDLVAILTAATTIIGSFIMMLRISPILTLVIVVTVPLAIFASRYISIKIRPLYRVRSRMLGELNGFAEEMISGQKTLKAYNREQAVIDSFATENDNVVQAYYRADYYGSLMFPCVAFVSNLSLTLISVIGAFMYMGGKILVGDIASFVLYSRKFSGPINEIANLYGELQSALAAAERVFKLLDEEPEKADCENSEQLRDVQGDVKISNVDFAYLPDKPVLTDFSLNAPRGSMIAIVGPTGAGKTTLINMLMRFYDIDSGSILVDEKDIYSVTRDSLRLSYSMVLQDTWLFYGTIYENIAYARPDATLDEVKAAARAAKIDDYIMSLPQGYDTILTDDAANISKGQKQLLTIARAMLMNSNMLILDEATSNVDTRTELKIQQAMRELMKDKTCFVVAHRLSTIQNADQILVINDGKVVESGTHRQLMDKKGFYRKLYDAQFE